MVMTPLKTKEKTHGLQNILKSESYLTDAQINATVRMLRDYLNKPGNRYKLPTGHETGRIAAEIAKEVEKKGWKGFSLFHIRENQLPAIKGAIKRALAGPAEKRKKPELDAISQIAEDLRKLKPRKVPMPEEEIPGKVKGISVERKKGRAVVYVPAGPKPMPRTPLAKELTKAGLPNAGATVGNLQAIIGGEGKRVFVDNAQETVVINSMARKLEEMRGVPRDLRKLNAAQVQQLVTAVKNNPKIKLKRKQ